MEAPEPLLRSVGIALLDALGPELAHANEKLAAALPTVARSAWKSWSKSRNEAQRRADIESLVQGDDDRGPLATAEIAGEVAADQVAELIPASAGEIRTATVEIVDQVAAGRSTEVRQVLAAYLEQLPAGIRQWLRRPSDPTGTTIPPQLGVRDAEDLLPFLPLRLALFHPGETALPSADWRLAELLGANEYSETWKAYRGDSPDGPTAVLKFFTEPWAARVLRGESLGLDRVMLHGKHPNVVPLKQIYLTADPPCLEYDYVPGGNLAGIISDWQMLRRRPSPAQVAQIVLRLAKTLSYSHRLVPPLLHRALKPANILVQNSTDGRFSFRIADFGCGGVANSHAVRQALRDTSAPAKRAAALRGACTALYASPQQLRGADSAARDDVYALGMIWYQLMTADLSSGRPVESRWRDHFAEQGMDASLVDLLRSCLEENPEDRPRDAGALANQLATLLNVDGERPKAVAAPPAPSDEEEPRVLARRVVNSVGVSLALLPAGNFKMGSAPSEAERGDDEGPQHEVTITKPLYMGIHPITQRQYELVMGFNPCYFRGAKGGGPDFPVENVSWHEADEFCKKLSELPAEKEEGRVYRLPTEAEWEYACRAGQATPFSYGMAISSHEANFNGHYPYGQASRGPYLERTSQVGSYPPNHFGLYDMHGNVWEWCSDYYDRYFYRHSPRFDPQGPPTGTLRVVRGGSCYNIGRFCRSAYRFGIIPENRDLDVGLRVVMEMKSNL
jgi:formylglycine-generating enzyme required for sulfatase activity